MSTTTICRERRGEERRGEERGETRTHSICRNVKRRREEERREERGEYIIFAYIDLHVKRTGGVVDSMLFMLTLCGK